MILALLSAVNVTTTSFEANLPVTDCSEHSNDFHILLALRLDHADLNCQKKKLIITLSLNIVVWWGPTYKWYSLHVYENIADCCVSMRHLPPTSKIWHTWVSKVRSHLQIELSFCWNYMHLIISRLNHWFLTFTQCAAEKHMSSNSQVMTRPVWQLSDLVSNMCTSIVYFQVWILTSFNKLSIFCITAQSCYCQIMIPSRPNRL